MQSDSTIRVDAWRVVALLVPVALLNYLDRQMLATMRESMMNEIPDLKLKENWGIVLGTFKFVYAIFSPIGGYISDRFSRRHVIVGSLMIWSLVTWLTGHVTSLNELIAARALMGISEAFYIPTALAYIADYHPGNTRSRAIGIHQSGIYLGLIIGGFAGYAAESPAIGWRRAFDLCGIVGVLYAMPLLRMLRRPPLAERETRNPVAAAGQLFSNGSYVLLVCYFTLPAIAGWVVKDWMPDILRERFQLKQGIAGVAAVLSVQVASLAGVVTGGILADRWMKRNVRGRIYVSAIGMSLFLPALFGVGNAASLAIAVSFLVLFGLGWGFFDCNNMPILCQIARPELRATGYGFMNLVSISCGGAGDWIFGRLRDQHMPLNVIFGAFAGIALLSVVIVLCIRPRRELSGVS